MEYSKMDPGLAGALEDNPADAQEMLAVSVRTQRPLSSQQQDELRSFGAQGVDSGLGIYSAIVDRAGLAELSKKPWVRLLSLARRMKSS